MASVLTEYEIRELLQREPPLVEDWRDLEEQVQVNGFDITVRDIAMPQSAGRIGTSNSERRLPDSAPLMFDSMGYLELIPGSYIITFNEIVHLPRDVMALGRPRSSLLRCGVTVDSAVWDAGYSGRSQSLMIVCNPYGFRLQKNSRVMQLVFWKLTGETEGYRGAYLNENT
jgi:dUTP pyrophosphatase